MDIADTVRGDAVNVILIAVVLMAAHDIPAKPEIWLQVGEAEKAIEEGMDRSK